MSFRAAAIGRWMVASMTVPAWPGLNAILALLVRSRSERAAQELVEQMQSKRSDKTAMIKSALEAQCLDKRFYSVGLFVYSKAANTCDAPSPIEALAVKRDESLLRERS